jgi:hypothetical protein
MRRRLATIRGIMVGVIWCALLVALARLPGTQWITTVFFFTVGPICGAVVERCWGGKGLRGGMIGGITSYGGFAIVMMLIAYYSGEPQIADPLGPSLGFFMLATFGAVTGWGVGFLIWAVMRIEDPFGKT